MNVLVYAPALNFYGTAFSIFFSGGGFMVFFLLQ